jgi:hypothetical protein
MLHAAITTSEFVDDDGGIDDRGFVELHNNGIGFDQLAQCIRDNDCQSDAHRRRLL